MVPAPKKSMTAMTLDELSNHSQRIRSGSIESENSGRMTVFVVDHCNDTGADNHLLFGVGSSDTVVALKAKIADRRGIPAAQQQLSFGGQRLEDDTMKLSQYGVRPSSCIHLGL